LDGQRAEDCHDRGKVLASAFDDSSSIFEAILVSKTLYFSFQAFSSNFVEQGPISSALHLFGVTANDVLGGLTDVSSH
jgi:hypothetical protein